MSSPTQQHAENQAAFRRLKPMIDQSYPKDRYVAIDGGRILADAATFDELTAALKSIGKDSPDVLVVQAGVDYPEFAYILVQSVNDDCRRS